MGMDVDSKQIHIYMKEVPVYHQIQIQSFIYTFGWGDIYVQCRLKG
jgi:hypothetical protein